MITRKNIEEWKLTMNSKNKMRTNQLIIEKQINEKQ
jgi:hypothetical protein